MNDQAKIIRVIEFDQYDTHFKIEWRSEFRWRNIPHYGDVPSTLTQCSVEVNGFIISTKHVYRDSRDKDNPLYAMKITVAKAFEGHYQIGKSTRKKFWELFFK